MLTKAVIKDIQSLQHKKFRDEQGLFIAEGPKLAQDLLFSDSFEVHKIYALKSWIDENVHHLTSSNRSKVAEVTFFELEKISQLSSPNQVLIVFKKPTYNNVVEVKSQLTLVLEDIQDPGNLGTIIRAADWFGVKNIICSMNTVDLFNSKVIQSTMSSIAHVNVYYMDLNKFLMQHKGVKKIAAVINGAPIKKQSYTQEAILMIGNESKGLSSNLLESADLLVTIPKLGKAESLNAAMATTIFLYELTQ